MGRCVLAGIKPAGSINISALGTYNVCKYAKAAINTNDFIAYLYITISGSANFKVGIYNSNVCSVSGTTITLTVGGTVRARLYACCFSAPGRGDPYIKLNGTTFAALTNVFMEDGALIDHLTTGTTTASAGDTITGYMPASATVHGSCALYFTH